MRAPRRSIGVAMSRCSSLSVSPSFNTEQVRVFKLYATPPSLLSFQFQEKDCTLGLFCGKGDDGNPLLEES